METLAKQKANQPDGVTVSTIVVFVTDSGGDEDTLKHIAASTHNLLLLMLLLVALPCLLHVHHCIVKRSLTFADHLCETLYSRMNAGMKCWDTIAKTISCWHDLLKSCDSVSYRQTHTRKNAATADQRTLGGGEYRRQRGEGVSRAKSVNIMSSNFFFFSHVHCATHLGVVSLNVRQLCLFHQCNIVGSASYARFSRSPPQWQGSHHLRP